MDDDTHKAIRDVSGRLNRLASIVNDLMNMVKENNQAIDSLQNPIRDPARVRS